MFSQIYSHMMQKQMQPNKVGSYLEVNVLGDQQQQNPKLECGHGYYYTLYVNTILNTV